jgi:hypothetical protein
MALSLQEVNEFGSGGTPFSLVGSGGTGGSVPIATVASPTRNFDVSPLAGLRPTDKYRGNLVSDITSALESYRLNQSVGRGGQYAQDVVRRYGATDIRAGAASYLQAAGLTFLADVVQPPPTQTTDPGDPLGDFFELPTVTNPPTQKNPFELLLDALPNFFGAGGTYNPPLQSQTYGYTPEQSFDSGGGISLMPILLLVVVAAVGYFLYKRYA